MFGHSIKVSAALLALIATISGCTPLSQIQHLTDFENIDLSDVVGALYMSPQASSWNFDSGGYIAFLHEDGRYELVKTASMDTGNPEWNEEGLFFSDVHTDYWLSFDGTLRKNASVKEAPGQDFGPFRATDGYYSLFNVGFSEESPGGYNFELLHATPDISEIVPFGYYPITAGMCGDDIYFVDYRDWGREDFNGEAQELRKLHPDNGFTELVAAAETPGLDWAPGPSPAECIESHIVYIAEPTSSDGDYSHDTRIMHLVRWNPENGERTFTKLTLNGAPIRAYDDQDVSYSFSEMEYFEGTLYALDASGRQLTVNPDTGEARILGERLVDLDGSDLSWWSFSPDFHDDSLAVFATDGKAEHDSFVEIRNRETGEQLRRIEYPGLRDLAGVDMVERGFAVNPQYLHNMQ